MDNLPFQSYNNPVMAPFFWEWRPFVAHLSDALDGEFVFGAKSFHESMRAAARIAEQELSQNTLAGDSTPKTFYESYCKEIFLKDPICNVIRAAFVKLGNALPPLAPALSIIDIIIIQEWLRRLPNGILFPILKTWNNAWSATFRTHCTVRLSYVFGCREFPDDVNHYVHCLVLWNAVGLDELDFFPDGVLKRLGLLEPSFSRFKVVAKAFHLHNHVRKHHSGIGNLCDDVITKKLAILAQHLVDLSRCP